VISLDREKFIERMALVYLSGIQIAHYSHYIYRMALSFFLVQSFKYNQKALKTLVFKVSQLLEPYDDITAQPPSQLAGYVPYTRSSCYLPPLWRQLVSQPLPGHSAPSKG
jgi:hypothetical protein